jgi:hypothetical protein
MKHQRLAARGILARLPLGSQEIDQLDVAVVMLVSRLFSS